MVIWFAVRKSARNLRNNVLWQIVCPINYTHMFLSCLFVCVFKINYQWLVSLFYSYSLGLLHWDWDSHCPSDSGATPKDMDKIDPHHNATKHSKNVTQWIYLGLYCTVGWHEWHACLCSHYLPASMLTHWSWDKMDSITQTTFSQAFPSMNIVVFWLNFHWNMLTWVR